MRPSKITENKIMNFLKFAWLTVILFSALTTLWGTAKADEGKYQWVAEAGRGVVLHEKCDGEFVQDASSHDGYRGQPYSDSYTFGNCN